MGTVDKALELLGYFSEQRPEIGLSEMARLAGFNKATTRRLLVALEQGGMVEQEAKSRNYHLGPGLLRLARVREATHPVEAAARPILEALTAETGETVHLSLAEGGSLATAAHIESRAHGTRVYIKPSERLPFHATASGLAYLAFAERDEAERALSADLARCTEHTVTDPQALRATLDSVRRTGVGVSDQGFENEVYGVAAPLFSRWGACCGAVAVATPSSRMTPQNQRRIIAAVRAAAIAITRAWGGEPPAALLRDTAA